MKLIKLTTGEQRDVSVWINPLSVQVINQKIGAKYKAVVVATGQSYLVCEDAEHIAKLVNEQIGEAK